MSSAAEEYLTNQIFIHKNIVTFRSLSRALKIPVNQAKKELTSFYHGGNPHSETFAVYWVSGEAEPITDVFTPSLSQQRKREPADDDEDERMLYDEDTEPEPVMVSTPVKKIMLVNADELEDVKASLLQVHSVHVYSLAPSRMVDAAHLCMHRRIIRAIDQKIPHNEMASTFGSSVGAHVKVGNADVVSGRSKLILVTPKRLKEIEEEKAAKAKAEAKAKAKAEKEAQAKAKKEAQAKAGPSTTKMEGDDDSKAEPAIVKAREDTKEQTKEREKVKKDVKGKEEKETEKPKATGKLDWSKATGKLDWSKAKGKTTKAKVDLATKDKATEQKGKPEKEKETKETATLKRKLATVVLTDSDGEESDKPKATSSKSAVKRNVIVSSDEDEESDAPRRLTKGKGMPTIKPKASERSLRSMMDIDDDEVTKVTRSRNDTDLDDDNYDDTSEAQSTHDMDVEDDAADDIDSNDDAPKRPKTRKPRKVAPVGKNGLKKRRVVKSRTTTDAKGYMQTEDYSSYESVDEEEAPEPEKPKPKKAADPPVAAAPKAKAKEKEKEKEKEKKADAEPKTTGSGAATKSKSTAGSSSKAAAKGKAAASAKKGSLLNFFGPDKAKK